MCYLSSSRREFYRTFVAKSTCNLGQSLNNRILCAMLKDTVEVPNRDYAKYLHLTTGRSKVLDSRENPDTSQLNYLFLIRNDTHLTCPIRNI